MCNRLHFKCMKQGMNVYSLLKMRGYKAYILKSGCLYSKGVILECGDSAFEFACQISDAFGLLATVEV